MGQSARHFRTHAAADSDELRARVAAEWRVSAGGSTHRARHRREQPLHDAGRARALGVALWHTTAPDRHRLRSVHRPRARRAELRLLPGRAVHPRGDAVRPDAGAGGRRASIDHHAAHRHRPAIVDIIRAGLCRRALRDSSLELRAPSSQGRRVDLPPAVDASVGSAERAT